MSSTAAKALEIEQEYKEEYFKLKDSGMFWEFFPTYTGQWLQDKDKFIAFKEKQAKQHPTSDSVNVFPCDVSQSELDALHRYNNRLSGFEDYMQRKCGPSGTTGCNTPPVDLVNAIKPNYYRRTIKGVEIDVIDIIKAWSLDFLTGNSLKYLLRSGKKNKDKEAEDLHKCIECLQRKMDT